MISLISIHNSPIDEVTYILYEDKDHNSDYQSECIVIDPFDSDRVLRKLAEYNFTLSMIIITHEHYDHIAGVNELKRKTGAKLICSKACSDNAYDARKNGSNKLYDDMLIFHGLEITTPTPIYQLDPADVQLESDTVLRWHDTDIHIKLTPGHSDGSICIMIENYIFTGDTLIRDKEIFTRLPGGNKKKYLSVTLPFLMRLDKSMVVCPGHGEQFVLGDSKYLYGGKRK